MGSTRIARRAGMYEASSATAESSAATPAKDQGGDSEQRDKKKQEAPVCEPATHFLRERGELDRGIGSEIVKDGARSRYNPSGPCGATHKDGGGGIGVHSTLAVVDINDGTRRAVQALRANIANDANNCG